MKKYLDAAGVLEVLHQLAEPEKIKFKARKYGIVTPNSLGIYHKDLKAIAKQTVRDDQLALDLFDSGVYEARLLCHLLFNPKSITPALMDRWISVFDTWEICDSYCMSFMGQSAYAYDKIFEYINHGSEYQKRAGFVLMVGYHFGHKDAPNDDFMAFLPPIKAAANDGRQYVKKAVNWALRTIGKRNQDLRQAALQTAEEILSLDSKAAKWIAKDAIRELSSPTVKIQDYPRSVYRPA